MIIRICEFVEGLPLGIELASSWIRVLSLSEILDEIEKDYSFLTTKRRDIPKRQRSIRVIFNYTWKILNTKEKNVFKKLYLFRGSFNKKAAAKVAGASISILSSLVDKSILKHNRMGRFEMHRLLRNFGEEKLNENLDEKKLAEKLYSEFYGDLLKEIKNDLISITKPEITEKIDRDLDDIKKGWELAVEEKYYDNLSKYISTLPYYFHIKSMFKDGLEMFNEAIDTLKLESMKIGDNKIRDEFYCRLLLSKCWMLNYLGFKGELKNLTDKSIKIATQYKLKSEIAQSNLYFGLYYFTVGDLSKEEEYLKKALSLFEKVKDYWFISNCYNLLGGLNHRKSDIKKAEEMWNKSYEASEKLGDKVGMARALNNLGTIFAFKGNLEKEKYLYEKSLEFYRDANNRLGISLATINLGLCYTFAGNYETAEELFKEAYKIREDIGNLMYIAESDFSLAINTYYSGKLDESKRLLFKILETTRKTNYRLLSARALKYLGIISNDEKDHSEALKYLTESIDIIGDKKTDEIISIYGHLGLTHFRLNNKKQSNEYFKKAFKTISETDLIYKVYLFEIIFNYANILVEENTEKAVELLSFLINQPETKIHYYYKQMAKNTLSQINTKISKNSFNKSIERGNSLTFNEIVDNILETKSR
jgi:tetratricopeptide (TPR) repeat protein